jgi:hypothetical protein
MTTKVHLLRITCKDVKSNKDINRDRDSKKGIDIIEKYRLCEGKKKKVRPPAV